MDIVGADPTIQTMEKPVGSIGLCVRRGGKSSLMSVFALALTLKTFCEEQ